MTELLNAHQHSSLTIALRSFEEELRQADAWLQGRLDKGILYRQTLTLPAEARAAARRYVADALFHIAEMAEEFGLEQLEEPLEASIAARMSLSWATLCDVRSDKLTRYGTVDPRLSPLLDSRSEYLAGLAKDIALLLRPSASR